MLRVRLFRSQRPIGFVCFDEAGYHIRPEGLLSRGSVDAIRKDLDAGRLHGLVELCHWYRQATPFCPLDPAKPCPCRDPECGLDG